MCFYNSQAYAECDYSHLSIFFFKEADLLIGLNSRVTEKEIESSSDCFTPPDVRRTQGCARLKPGDADAYLGVP